jgi:UDP-N-acetylglucosamine:LPS N-acetylglucosamine transferase
MKVLISGGGTGGHIYPALALLKEIKKQEPNAFIRWNRKRTREENHRKGRNSISIYSYNWI